MSTFNDLLQLAGTEEPSSLFGRAWQLWGTVHRTMEPRSAEGELRSAHALMSILLDAGLTAKELKQANLCISSVSACLATLEPDAAASSRPPATAEASGGSPATKATKPHAGLRHAPRPDALPSPSMLLGSSLMGAKRAAAATPVAARGTGESGGGSSGGEVGFTSPSPPTAHPTPPAAPAAPSSPESAPTLEHPPSPAAPPSPEAAPTPERPPPPPPTAAVVCGKGKMLLELEAAVGNVAPEGRRQLVGEWTYAAVSGMPGVPDPPKITGMLLDLPMAQLLGLLADPSQLAPAVAQAVEALQVVEAAQQQPQEPKEPGWVQREVAARPKPPPKAAPTNAKTRLCKYWVQRGHCMQGDKCTFAHGMPDMTEGAQQRAVTKIETGMAKKGPASALAFMPLQAMARKPKAAPTKPKPAADPSPEQPAEPTAAAPAAPAPAQVAPAPAAEPAAAAVAAAEPAAAADPVAASLPLPKLTLARLETIQTEAMADDVPIELARMSLWTREQAVAYFESGGVDEP